MKQIVNKTWSEVFSEYRRKIDETTVRVVILGPGKGNTGFEKRIKIKEHLSGMSKHYDVVFPEDIKIPSDILPNSSEWARIGFVIGHANIIIALLINDIKVSGVLTEISKYEDNPGFRDKAYLLVPKEKNKAHKSSPLIWQAITSYSKEHRLVYTEEEFGTCLKIRNFAATVVDEYRKKEAWKEFQKQNGLTTTY